MISVIIDNLTYILTGFKLNTFYYQLYYLSINDLIKSLLIVYLLTNEIYLIISILIMYLSNKVIYKYIKYNLVFSICIYTIFYIIMNEIDYVYFINIIIVILLYYKKYNEVGDNYENNI